MANVKVPALLYKMSKASQKAWYKKNNMKMPDEPVERSAAAAKRVKVAPRKASDVKPDSVRAINTARMAAYMAKGGRAPIGAAGSGGNSVMAGSNMSTVRGIITGIKAGFNPTVSLDPYESERAKKTGPRSLKLKKEEVEQVDEGSKRMSAAVKLQRAFEREKTSSDTSRERGKEILAQARAEYAKKQAAKTNEEVEQVDEATKRALNITKADLEVIKSGNHETVKNHMAKMISRATDHKTNARPLRSDKAKEFLDKIHGSTNVGQLQKMAYNIYLGGDDEGKAKYGKLHVYNPQSAKGRDYQKRYGIGEEVEQVDEVNYKKYLKVSQEKRPLTPSAVDAALSAEKEGNPNPARKLRNTQDARKFANKQLTKQFAKTRPAQKFPVYEPGRKYVGDSVELDGPVIDEANSRNSATAMQQALTPKASDVKAAVGTTARDKATTNKYARRISKLTGGDYSKQDVKSNLMSLKKEDTEMKYIEEKLTAADPASKYIKDFVASENPKFAEKSKKERISMALGAYYAAKGKKNEEVEQINEGPSHFLYSGEVNSKNYEYVVPARKVLGNGLDDDDIHKALKRNDNNDHLEHHEIKAIVDSQGEPDSHVEVTHKGKTYTHHVINHEEPRHMYEEIVLEEPKDAADVGEYDYEGDMAKSQLRSIMANSKRMYDMLEDTTNLPEWVQSKITLAEDYIVTASNYMESDMNEEVEQVDEAIRGTIRSLKGIMVRRPADQAERDKLASDITANRKYNKGKKIGRVSGDVRKNAAGMTDAQKLVRTLYDKSGRSNKELGTKKFPYSEEVEQVTEAEGTVAVTPKEKSLAAHHGDKTKITFGDVIKARLKSAAAKKMGK